MSIVESIGKYVQISSQTTGHSAAGSNLSFQRRVKRLLDVVIASAALAALLPLLLVLAVAIKIDSRGAVLFRQKRWGKDNSTIVVLKFRTMETKFCDDTGVLQTVKDDPRVTRIGRMLRQSNLDELPQLWNVIRGDMSLVGPRCHALGMKAAGMVYEDLVPEYHQRHRVRPGITGLAQMRGFRGPTDNAYLARARINADIFYVENFSLLLDLKILAGTVRNELMGGTGF